MKCREWSVQALYKMADERPDELLALVQRNDVHEADLGIAAEALGRLNNNTAFQALLVLLGSYHPVVREGAVAGLGSLRIRLDEVRNVLRERTRPSVEASPGVREAAADALEFLVEVEVCSGFEDHVYETEISGKKRSWLVTDLWAEAEGIPAIPMKPQDVPEWSNLMAVEVGACWGKSPEDETNSAYTFEKLVKDVRRVLDADLNKPVLLGPDGRVMDGVHRLIKACIVGENVLVVHFDDWP